MAAHAIALAAAALCVVAVALLTFEGMIRLGRAYNRHREAHGGPLGRLMMLRLVLGLVLMHALSICVFGAAYWVLLQIPDTGSIGGTGHHHASVFDAFYMSAMTYSTVGFGDLTPRGAVRWLAGTEALVGLMHVAWTASFAFMEISRHWRNDLR